MRVNQLRPPLSTRAVATAALAAFALAAGPAASPAAASGQDVLRDCVNNTLAASYPAADIAAALERMPSDVDEYTDCRDQIRNLQTAAGSRPKASAARASAGGGGGAAASATDNDTAARFAEALGATADGAGGATATATTPATTPESVGDDAGAREEESAAVGAGELPWNVPVDDELDADQPVDDKPQRAPIVPISLAFAAIVLSGARVLARWGARADSLDQ